MLYMVLAIWINYCDKNRKDIEYKLLICQSFVWLIEMKKFIIVLIFIICFAFAAILSNKSIIYDFKLVVPENVPIQTTNLGDVFEEKYDNQIVYKSNKEIIGECIIFKNRCDLNKICEKLGIVVDKKYNSANVRVIDGYSPLLKYSIKGYKNNVQIAISDGKIIIANPIIFGGY